ncbi:MAG: flavodoxin family protein [Pseudomonadota bacterium]
MKITIINGNPKSGGFTEKSLNIVASYLKKKDLTVDYIGLADKRVLDCIGCFNCLKTGECVLNDDVSAIIQTMLESDGFVIGSPVRNAYITACYKRFIERITYILGFTLALENKYTMGISSVGYLGGKSANKKFCCLQGVFHAHLSSFVFSSVGIPANINFDTIESRLLKGADKLIQDISTRKERTLFDKISFLIDRTVVRKFMLEKQPEVYANVIKSWQSKGYMTTK